MTFGKMLHTFSFRLSTNLSKQKSPTAEIIGIYFIETIVPIKYMPIISAVGLFVLIKKTTKRERVQHFFPNVLVN